MSAQRSNMTIMKCKVFHTISFVTFYRWRRRWKCFILLQFGWNIPKACKWAHRTIYYDLDRTYDRNCSRIHYDRAIVTWSRNCKGMNRLEINTSQKCYRNRICMRQHADCQLPSNRSCALYLSEELYRRRDSIHVHNTHASTANGLAPKVSGQYKRRERERGKRIRTGPPKRTTTTPNTRQT